MASKDRKYDVVEDIIGGPPNSKPVLSQNGNIIPKDQLIIFNKDRDRINKSDHYKIRFDIKGFSQSSLRFTPSEDDVLWVKKGTGPDDCPTSPCHDLSDTIWVAAMDEAGEWIDVINMDMSKQEFWFTLNLVPKNNPTSTNYVPVDPGGGNENGGLKRANFDLSSFGVFALGVGAGILALGGAQLLLAQ